MVHASSSLNIAVPAYEPVVRIAPPALNALIPESAAAALARSEISARGSRGRFFKASLFSDPAWDILLELFDAAHENRQVSVSSVGLTAGIPQTTALRWINALEREGLIDRACDPRDGRRTFLNLSDSGLTAMYRYFQDCRRSRSPRGNSG